jgi:hypothetical protein
VQVWLVAYRKFPSLAQLTPPGPASLITAPQLDLPACSNPAMATIVQAYKPCSPIASVSNSTAAISSGQGSATYEVTVDVMATICPGLSGLHLLQGQCQYTHLFGLGSTAADFYLAAEDTNPTNNNLEAQCAAGNAALTHGVWRTDCRYADALDMPATHQQTHCAALLRVVRMCTAAPVQLRSALSPRPGGVTDSAIGLLWLHAFCNK